MKTNVTIKFLSMAILSIQRHLSSIAFITSRLLFLVSAALVQSAVTAEEARRTQHNCPVLKKNNEY